MRAGDGGPADVPRGGAADPLSWARACSRLSFSAVLAAPVRMAEDTIILPLRDGITLKPVKVVWDGPGGLFYVDVHELDVDMTEVKLVRSEKTLRAIQELGILYCRAGLEFVATSRQPARLRNELEGRLKAGLISPMVFVDGP